MHPVTSVIGTGSSFCLDRVESAHISGQPFQIASGKPRAVPVGERDGDEGAPGAGTAALYTCRRRSVFCGAARPLIHHALEYALATALAVSWCVGHCRGAVPMEPLRTGSGTGVAGAHGTTNQYPALWYRILVVVTFPSRHGSEVPATGATAAIATALAAALAAAATALNAAFVTVTAPADASATDSSAAIATTPTAAIAAATNAATAAVTAATALTAATAAATAATALTAAIAFATAAATPAIAVTATRRWPRSCRLVPTGSRLVPTAACPLLLLRGGRRRWSHASLTPSRVVRRVGRGIPRPLL